VEDDPMTTDTDTRHRGDGAGLEARREMWTRAGPVVSALPPQEVLRLQERAEASVGEPGAMGLFGFAVGTLLIAVPITGQLPRAATSAALPAVLVFAGIAQFVAGLVAYRKGITFAGTAFCCYGANNTLIATYYLFAATGLIGGTAADRILLGVELFCFAYISLVLAVAAAKVNVEFVLILLALIPGFGLAAVPQIGGPAGLGHLGGWFLVASAALAFYGASALVLNSAYQRTVLPLLSRA
jgi:succinate-acetate transporter protein